MRAAVLAIMSLTLLASTQDLSTLVNTSDLSDAPGEGRRLGVLLSGSPVRVLERNGDWVRVSVEGWIEAGDLGPAGAGAMAQTGARGRITGAVFVTEEDGSTTVGSAVAVRLLGDADGFHADIAPIRDACDSRRREIEEEIATLKEEGDRAMRSDDTSEAFRRYDEAKSRLRREQKTLETHDRDCDARLEQVVEGHTVARTITGSDGRYEIQGIAPGHYILHVQLDSGDRRDQWDVAIDLGPGEEMTRDLTGANRTGRF